MYLASRYVGTNFIMAFCLNCSAIRTLVNVFVDIFDHFDGATNFQIDVAVKPHQEFSGMRYHMSIVKYILTLLDSPAIFRASVIGIAILLNDGVWSISFGKSLFADIVFNAPLRGAGTMKHISGDNRVKLRMKIEFRNLC